MSAPQPNFPTLDARASAFYRHALVTLREQEIPFLVGGAYAFGRYTGIVRDTKDFDLFVHRRHAMRALRALASQGYRAELTYPHWLGKVFHAENFVDVIFDSGNGVAPVDDEWFAHAREGHVFDVPVHFVPPEEMIWQKSLVQERERYDGADIAHLLQACAVELDWERLLARYGEHWRVLLAHLVLFGFVYPGERTLIPAPVMRRLLQRLDAELDASDGTLERVCRGPILSRAQYLVDVDLRGYQDARLEPSGGMSAEEIDHWTASIETSR